MGDEYLFASHFALETSYTDLIHDHWGFGPMTRVIAWCIDGRALPMASVPVAERDPRPSRAKLGKLDCTTEERELWEDIPIPCSLHVSLVLWL